MRSVLIWCCLLFPVAECLASPQSGIASALAGAPTSDTLKVPITSRSDEAVALYRRGRAFNENLQPHEGYALFREALARDSLFALAEYGLGMTAPTAKETLEHLHRALELAQAASDGERLLIRAALARIHNGPTAWGVVAESLVTAFPADERAHWILGSAYSAQQLFGRAIGQYEQAIAINPQFSLAYNSVGYAHRGAGNWQAAEAAFQQYIALVPHDPNPYDSYGELLLAQGRFDDAITQYTHALAIDPHFSGSFVGIAAGNLYAGRPDAAIAEANRYLRLARDDHERRAALLMLTLIQIDLGATDAALEMMQRMSAVAKATGDSASMSADAMMVGDILLEAGRDDAAQEWFGVARDLVSSSSLPGVAKADTELLTLFNMARVALARHDLLTARSGAEEFMRQAKAGGNPDRIRQSHELNGLVALAASAFDESLTELALANQHDPAICAAMARAYRGKGDTARAAELLDSAAHLYTLPTLTHVFVRAEARRARPLQSGEASPNDFR